MELGDAEIRGGDEAGAEGRRGDAEGLEEGVVVVRLRLRIWWEYCCCKVAAGGRGLANRQGATAGVDEAEGGLAVYACVADSGVVGWS